MRIQWNVYVFIWDNVIIAHPLDIIYWYWQYFRFYCFPCFLLMAIRPWHRNGCLFYSLLTLRYVMSFDLKIDTQWIFLCETDERWRCQMIQNVRLNVVTHIKDITINFYLLTSGKCWSISGKRLEWFKCNTNGFLSFNDSKYAMRKYMR